MVNVGEKLREARRAQALSLRELAARADVSASLLSQIENGKVNPTVMSMYNIAAALGLPVNHFFPGDAEEPTMVALALAEEAPAYSDRNSFPDQAAPGAGAAVLRRARLDPVVRAEARQTIELMGGVIWARLTPAAEEMAEFLEVNYPPGASSGPAMSQHAGREFQLVLEGELTLELAFERYVLRPGDSIVFDSTLPHRLLNRGEVPMRAISVVLNH